MNARPLWTDYSSFVVEYDEPEYARFAFDSLYASRQGDLYAEVEVASTCPGEEEVLIEGRLNLQAPLTVKGWAKAAAERANGRGHLDWPGMFAAACVEVKRAYREGEPGIELRQVDDSGNDDLIVPPLLLDANPTVLFGHGGTGKSLLALALGAAINGASVSVGGCTPTRTTRVMLLDWEFDARQHKRRLHSICGDEMPSLFYLRCSSPLRSMVDRIKRLVARERIGYLICDSMAGMIGGDPNEAEVVNGAFNALRAIGLGSLVIAHIRKENGEDMPLGSVMGHNLARLTWFVKKVQEHGQADFDVTLTCKKNNLAGRWPLPINLHLSTDDGGKLRIARRLPEDIPTTDSADHGSPGSLRARILEHLDDQTGTVEQIAEALGIKNLDSLRTVINRLANEGAIESVGLTSSRYKIWGRPGAPW